MVAPAAVPSILKRPPMSILRQLYGFLAVGTLLLFQPFAIGSVTNQGKAKKKPSNVETIVVDGPSTQQESIFSMDALAEPGRTAADTLRRLKEGTPEPLPPGKRKKGGPGISSVTVSPPVWTIPPGASGYNITLSAADTGVVFNGTPYPEQFSLMIPAGYNPSSPPPLVVAWHGYGSSHIQPMGFLATEANNRGWILMAPLGIADNTFSWLPGQQAVEKSIDWLRANYPYNESRVYGVGFSMGAMCISNFAARHLDQNWTRFAALATVCATFDNTDNYTQTPSLHSLFEWMFGGIPYGAPFNFEYYRTSTLRLTMPMISPYPPVEGVTLARSLANIPVYMTWSTDDNQVPYSPRHNQSFITYLTSLGNAPTQVPVSGLTLKHHWTVLNVVNCFDFLAPKTLVTKPTSYTVLADVDGSFHNATTSSGASGQFRRFDLNVNAPSGNVQISSTSNITNLSLDFSGYGFAGGGDVNVATGTVDATTDRVTIIIPATAAPPSKVRVDSVDNYNWNYDGGVATSLIAPAGSHTTDILYNTFDFNLAISGTPAIGANITVDITGGADGDLYWLLVSDAAGVTPLSIVGDGDPRWLNLDIFTMYIGAQGALSGGGQDQIPVTIPNDPILSGVSFQLQNVTAPGSVAGIPFFFGRISNKTVLTIL